MKGKKEEILHLRLSSNKKKSKVGNSMQKRSHKNRSVYVLDSAERLSSRLFIHFFGKQTKNIGRGVIGLLRVKFAVILIY